MTPSDHKALIRLASILPVGSEDRQTLLRLLTAEDKVQVLNEKGRKVWVSKETLKGPDAKKYKPVKDDDKGGDKGGDKPWKGKPQGLAEALTSSAMDFLKKHGDGELNGVSAKNITQVLKMVPKSALKDKDSLDKYRMDGDFWKMGEEGEEWDELLGDVAAAIESIGMTEDEDEGDRNIAAWKSFLEGTDPTDQLKKDHEQAKADKADKKKKDGEAELAEAAEADRDAFLAGKLREEKEWRGKQQGKNEEWRNVPKEDEKRLKEEWTKEWEEQWSKKKASDRAALIRLASTLPDGDHLRRAILAGLSRTADEHKPGDVWKTDSGRWRAMDPKGRAWSFEDKDDASLYAKGKRPGKGKGEDKSKGSGDLTKALGEASKALKENKAEVEKALDTPKVKKALDDWEALDASESAERKAKVMEGLQRAVVGAIPGGVLGTQIAAVAIPGVAMGGMAGAALAAPVVLATAAVLGLGYALFGSEGSLDKTRPAPSEAIRKKNMEEQERKKTAAKSLKDQLLDHMLNPSKEAIEMLPKAIDKDGNLDVAKVQKAMERSEGKKASDRKALIRLAASLPSGDAVRRAILRSVK